MPKPEIEEFAKKLVENIRDAAIKNCDSQLNENMNAPVAKRWRELKKKGNLEELQKTMISDCIDEVVFSVLMSIDQGLLNISYKTDSGKAINLPEEGLGELSGWYMGSGGWRAIFSKERFVDDFSDMT